MLSASKASGTPWSTLLFAQMPALEVLTGWGNKVRVFRTRDAVQAQYAASCLEQAGAHTFVYSRMPTMSAQGEAGIVGEHKVLVPPGEVLAAEELLGELGLLGNGQPGSESDR